MNIRKGKIEDMSSVLDLIKELATFEKEPNAVVVTVADLDMPNLQHLSLCTFSFILDNNSIVRLKALRKTSFRHLKAL